MLNSHKELLVWQRGMELVKEIYIITADFPKEEMFGLTSQMRRSAISVPSNIAEGFGRKHKKDFSRFISMAFASASELETQLELSKRLGLIKGNDCAKCEDLLLQVMKMLNKLYSNLKLSSNS